MCDFAEIIPLLNPFLDRECRALLLTLCKSIREVHWEMLQPKLSPEILAQIEAIIAVLNNSQGFRYYVVRSGSEQTMTIALAVHYRCLDTIGINLRFLVSNLNFIASFATMQRRFKTQFNLAARDLAQQPRIRVSTQYDGFAILNQSNGATIHFANDMPWPTVARESTTRFQFHLRPLRLKCDVEGEHGQRTCHWSHITAVLWAINDRLCRPQIVYVLNRASCNHLYTHVKEWCRFQQRLQEPIELRDTHRFYTHEGPALDCIVVFIPADTKAELVAMFKYSLMRAYSHSGKARIDVYIIVEAMDLAGVFFGIWNHTLCIADCVWSEQCLKDVTHCSSLAGHSAWSQFNNRLESLFIFGLDDDRPSWIDFSYRIPDRIPYRVRYPLPSLLEAVRGNATWMSYFIELENHSIQREDGTPALAILSIERGSSGPDEVQLFYMANIYAPAHASDMLVEKESCKERLIRRFEIHFWTLTGNHWHDYPHRFNPIEGLYQPRTDQGPIEIAVQHQEIKRERSRSRSPIREVKRVQQYFNP